MEDLDYRIISRTADLLWEQIRNAINRDDTLHPRVEYSSEIYTITQTVGNCVSIEG